MITNSSGRRLKFLEHVPASSVLNEEVSSFALQITSGYKGLQGMLAQRPTYYVFQKSSCIHGMFGTLFSFNLDVSTCSHLHCRGFGQKTGTKSICQTDPHIAFCKALWDQQDVPRQVSPGISQETCLRVSEIQIVWMHAARSQRVWRHLLMLALRKCHMHIDIVLKVRETRKFLEKSGQRADLRVMALRELSPVE